MPSIDSSLAQILGRQIANNSTPTTVQASAKPVCGGGGLESNTPFSIGLHIGALFIILTTSVCGAFFPILSKRFPVLKIPDIVFIFIKFFGSGVIIATAFIHMLPSAFNSLSNPCLPDFWIKTYTAAPGALAMGAAIAIFLVDFGSTRYLASVDRHISRNVATSSAGSGTRLNAKESSPARSGDSSHFGHHHLNPPPVEGDIDDHTAMTQKLGVLILEAGIIFHSVFIGLTLAISTGSDFVSLFITIIFHQTFEGLALGSRIATLAFKRRDWRPWAMALVYACTTPIGIAIGLGVRLSYEPNSQRALISAGVFDAVSAGLLIYASMVELLAHDFILGEMRTAPRNVVVLATGSLLAGCLLMSLLGRWA